MSPSAYPGPAVIATALFLQSGFGVSADVYHPVVVAVTVVWMVQVPVHQVVRVARVRHRGVATAIPVDVSAVVGAARMVWGTAGWVGVALGELMAVRVPVVGVVQVPVVKVVHVVLVNDRGMSAARSVRVGMLVVSLVHDESLIQQMMNYRSLWGMSSVCGPPGQLGAGSGPSPTRRATSTVRWSTRAQSSTI